MNTVTKLIVKYLFAIVIAVVSLTVLAKDAVDIKPAELLAADSSEWLILDVRSAEEYAEGHVPGAINIPHTDVAAQMSIIQTYKDKPVVVYCRSGYRAGKAADILLEADFSDVRHLEGDIMGWRDAGHKLEQ